MNGDSVSLARYDLSNGLTYNSANSTSNTPHDVTLTVPSGSLEANGIAIRATTSRGQISNLVFTCTSVPQVSAPGAPTIGTATAGDGQASISFTAPASDGGAAITSYTVTSSPGGHSGTGSTSPITVAGLTNGTSYTFTVTATNSAGTSTASSTSSAVTPVAGLAAPVASNAALTVSANSSANPVTLSLSGGTAASVAVASQASHGTATASGIAISYTPMAGYAGSDSFTYTATNATGTSAPATVTVTINAVAPGAPAIGTATAGNGQALISFTAPASNGGAAITSYSVTSNPGGLVGTGAASPMVVGSLTNGVSYTFTVTANNAVGTGPASSASNAVTPQPPPPTTNSFTYGTAVPYNTGSATATFIDVSGHVTNSPTSYSVGSTTTARGGAVSITSAGLASYTPKVGYHGSDSFTFTATNGGGTSSAATVTVMVNAPTITVSPTTLIAGSFKTPYSHSLTASGGKTAYTFNTTPASGALPAGLTLASNGMISGTPTAIGTFFFRVSGTDSSTSDTSGPVAFTSGTISLTINAVAPGAPTIGTATAGNGQALVSFTAPASNGGAAITSYSVTSSPGGLVGTGSASPIVVAGLTNGTAYNFTVAATNSSGTGSASAASNLVTPTGPLQAPIANSVTTTVAANSSVNPITLNITGGAAASVAIASNPSHGTASASGTSITYTPVAGYSGADSFTYTAANASGTSAAATVTVIVSAPSLSFTPAAGTLAAGTVGTAYNQTIAAASGSAPYTYAVTAGALPAGLSLNPSNGTISGSPTASGTFGFSITATDANAASGAANYSLTVRAVQSFVFTPASGALESAMAGESYSQSITAKGGSGSLLYSLSSGDLPKGMSLNVSTGELSGPLSSDAEPKDYAFTVQVRDQPGSVGTASYSLTVKKRAVAVTDTSVTVAAGATPNNVDLTRGATGGPFLSADLVSIEPPNAGTFSIVRGEFAQASPPIQMGWYLKYIPNPAYSGQVRVNYRLVSALGTSNIGVVTYTVGYDAAEVANEVDGLVRDFVKARQDLISSTVKVPGLLERRKMAEATDPVSSRMIPSDQGMTASFSTSLAQLQSARDSADGVAGGYSSPFNIWIDGTFLAHNDKDINGGKWGSFAMLNVGADYLLTEKALLGLSFHYDHMTDPTDEDADLKGNGWLAGPYASFEIGKNVFWNGSVFYGGSSNDINTQFWDGTFRTRRLFVDTSIEGQWHMGDDTTLSPKLRAVYFSEDVNDYSVKNSAGDTIGIDGFNEEQFRLSLGAEIARSFRLDSGSKLTPKLGLTGGFSGMDGSGAFGSVTAGVSLKTADLWILDTSLLLNVEGDGQKSVGAKVVANRSF